MAGPNPYEERTTQKLEFAKIYLDERLKHGETGATLERAHEETFLFHLIGAKDSFLQEINHAFGLRLPEHSVNERTLRTGLQGARKSCTALDEIEALLQDQHSWLHLANWFRNQGMHRDSIKRGFYAGGQKDGTAEFIDPYSKQPMGQSLSAFLSDCFDRMVKLILRLRSTLPQS